MLASGKTGIGTGCGNSLIDYFSVTLGRNNFLSYKNRITYRAVLAFGKTGIGAGCGNSFINYFGVTLGRNNFLSNKNGVTYRTVLAFGKTGGGASCGNSLIDYFSVTECTSWRISGCALFSTTWTLIIVHGSVGARCGWFQIGACRGLACEIMSEFGNRNRRTRLDCVTYRTMDWLWTVGCAGCGSINRIIGLPGVSGCADCFGFCGAAACAGVCFNTGTFAGRGCGNYTCVPAVTECVTACISRCAFCGTAVALIIVYSGVGAGCSRFQISGRCVLGVVAVTECGNILACIGISAGGASILWRTFLGAGCFRFNGWCVTMSCCSILSSVRYSLSAACECSDRGRPICESIMMSRVWASRRVGWLCCRAAIVNRLFSFQNRSVVIFECRFVVKGYNLTSCSFACVSAFCSYCNIIVCRSVGFCVRYSDFSTAKIDFIGFICWKRCILIPGNVVLVINRTGWISFAWNRASRCGWNSQWGWATANACAAGFGVIIATNIIVNIKRVCFTANPGISNFPIPICALSWSNFHFFNIGRIFYTIEINLCQVATTRTNINMPVSF